MVVRAREPDDARTGDAVLECDDLRFDSDDIK
jgi:hypothetical protein